MDDKQSVGTLGLRFLIKKHFVRVYTNSGILSTSVMCNDIHFENLGHLLLKIIPASIETSYEIVTYPMTRAIV